MPNTSSKYLLEIACFDPESCVLAQDAGADRIEFCRDYRVGGITPHHDDILKVRELLHIPLHVIIRPRAGNFVYSAEEIELMKRDILFCRQHRINGVVFGVLKNDNTINIKLNSELLQLSKPLSNTFHRAIDLCPDTNKAFEDIIEIGFTNVLTSGGKQTASEGVAALKEYNEKFGKKIIITPAGRIRSENINFILAETKSKEIHSAAITTNDNLVDVKEVGELKDKLDLFVC